MLIEAVEAGWREIKMKGSDEEIGGRDIGETEVPGSREGRDGLSWVGSRMWLLVSGIKPYPGPLGRPQEGGPVGSEPPTLASWPGSLGLSSPRMAWLCARCVVIRVWENAWVLLPDYSETSSNLFVAHVDGARSADGFMNCREHW